MSEINFEYKKLHPFKWFILENFPFLEDSLDVLTNYQLFCKLGEEININRDNINTLGEQVETLTDAFNALHDYVDTYFENLDVQEEINNKLDELVEDGTLENLIGAYIQPRIDAQNELIDERMDNQDAFLQGINNKVDALSLAPIPVSSTDQMTNTNKIYVLTSDGYWYYYTGSTWSRGGVYQASVDPTDVDELKDNLAITDENILNLLNNANIDVYLDWEIGRIDRDGNDEPNADLYRTKNYIPINKDVTYNFKGYNGNGCSIRVYDSSKNYSRNINFPATSTSNEQNVKFDQANDAYFRLSINAYQNNIELYPVVPTNIDLKILNITHYNTEATKNFNQFKDGITYITGNNDLVNGPTNTGNYVVITQRSHQYLTLQIAILQNRIKQGNDSRYKHLGAYYRLFNPENTSQQYLRWSLFNYELKSQDNYVAFGDSITHGFIETSGGSNVITDYPYPQTVGNLLKLIPNEGANTGSGYIVKQNNNNAVTIIDNYDFTNVNMVTLFFGTNDWNANVPLGTISDTTVNPTTIYGGIKHCIEKIANENPYTTIIMITPINRSQVGNSGAGSLIFDNNYAYGTPNTAGYTLGDVCQAVVNCANYYGLSYIDNREGCPINRLNLSSTLIDGLHPNDTGYIKLGQHLASKINSLFIPYHF